MVKHILLIGLLFPSISLFADTDLNQSTFGPAKISSVESTSSDYHSKIWNISNDDWVRYEEIMLGKKIQEMNLKPKKYSHFG